MDERKTYTSQGIPKKDKTPPQSGGREDEASAGGKESGRSYVQMLYNELCRFADVIVENSASQRLGVHTGNKPQKSAPKPQKIPNPPPDNELDRIYRELRTIERRSPHAGGIRGMLYSREINTQLFYKQAVFMRDFSDNCGFTAPFEVFSTGNICYERMSREQLRTFFSWRREVREGTIRRVPYTYALLYIYELLGLDCAEDAQKGLDKILSFWRKFRLLDDTLDRHLPKLLMDYYIYYLPDTPLDVFVEQCGIKEHFDRRYKLNRDDELLRILYKASKYNIRESAFYKSEGAAELMDECMLYTANHLDKCFQNGDIGFWDCIYRLSRTSWKPFGDIPFYQRTGQKDRTVVITPNDSYFCKGGRWYHKSAYLMDSGKNLAGYTVKCTEAALRRATRYKRKITANPDMLDYTITRKLTKLGISLEDEITTAVAEFLAQKNKKNRTVVAVNTQELERIRNEASEIQEKLTVEDSAATDVTQEPAIVPDRQTAPNNADVWRQFADLLTQAESGALRKILSGGDFRGAADAAGVMAEVLADGINEKAFDTIGDSIMEFDGDAVIFDEYRDKLTEVLK